MKSHRPNPNPNAQLRNSTSTVSPNSATIEYDELPSFVDMTPYFPAYHIRVSYGELIPMYEQYQIDSDLIDNLVQDKSLDFHYITQEEAHCLSHMADTFRGITLPSSSCTNRSFLRPNCSLQQSLALFFDHQKKNPIDNIVSAFYQPLLTAIARHSKTATIEEIHATISHAQLAHWGLLPLQPPMAMIMKQLLKELRSRAVSPDFRLTSHKIHALCSWMTWWMYRGCTTVFVLRTIRDPPHYIGQFKPRASLSVQQLMRYEQYVKSTHRAPRYQDLTIRSSSQL